MQSFFSGLALEVHQQTSKKNGKLYSSLKCYEFGQNYPELTSISLTDVQVPVALQLAGKMADIEVTSSIYEGRQVLYFVTGKPQNIKAAA